MRSGHGRHRPETKAKIDRPSKSGSDLWEMVEYSDPFSVHYGTTSPIEGHPEFSSSSMASPNSFSAVSTVSLSTEGPDELDDCRGSDSCSDYEVHSNSGNDDDSDSWEDVTEDSGARRFQFVDPVAEMLDSVVQSGVLPREHIFYKLVSSALKYGSYDHSKGEKYQWDPTVVGRDRFFVLVKAEPSILYEDLVVLILANSKLEFLCQANERCAATNLAILWQVALLKTFLCPFCGSPILKIPVTMSIVLPSKLLRFP